MLAQLILSFNVVGVISSGVVQEVFHAIPGCERGWESTDHVIHQTTTRSTISCCQLCARAQDCIGVNICHQDEVTVSCTLVEQYKFCGDLVPASDCTYLQNEPSSPIESSSPISVSPTPLRSSCDNGGTWTGTGCVCVWGYAGVWCERLVRSCREAAILGVTGQGFYSIQPLGSPTVYTVYCNCNWGGTIYALKRIVPPPSYCSPISFNRTWEDYKNGFGNIDCEYFLGLETMFQLSQYGEYNLDLYNVVRDEGTTAVRLLETNLKSDSWNYALNFSTTVSHSWEYADDAFDESEKPRSFCTWDRDCGGCAGSVGAGWWFKSDCTGGALTAPVHLMTWPVHGVQKIIEQSFIQMDLQHYIDS